MDFIYETSCPLRTVHLSLYWLTPNSCILFGLLVVHMGPCTPSFKMYWDLNYPLERGQEYKGCDTMMAAI